MGERLLAIPPFLALQLDDLCGELIGNLIILASIHMLRNETLGSTALFWRFKLRRRYAWVVTLPSGLRRSRDRAMKEHVLSLSHECAEASTGEDPTAMISDCFEQPGKRARPDVSLGSGEAFGVLGSRHCLELSEG